MHCSNCGNVNPEGAKFCSVCGAQQPETTQPVYANQQPVNSQQFNYGQPINSNQQVYNAPQTVNSQQMNYGQQMYYNQQPNIVTPKPAKKSNKVLIIVLAILGVFVAAIIGLIALGASVEDDTNTTNSSYQNDIDDNDVGENDYEETPTVNSAYSEVFTSRNIVEGVSPILGLSTKAFVHVDNTGMVEKLEFGYSVDKVKELYDVVYFPIADYTDEQKDLYEQSIKDVYDAYKEDGFCSIEYSRTDSYMVISLHFTNLDNAANIQKLSNMGMIPAGFATYISMQQTESGLVAGGYIKK